jgi:hypothetical protein
LFESFGKDGAGTGLNWSEGLLLAFGMLLVIGLIGEWRKGKDERWGGLADTFELMVIIGVAGELLFDGLIFGFSGRLSRIQDAAVTVATDRATDAGFDAAHATVVAGEANERAAKANERAQQSSLRVEVLRKDNDQKEQELLKLYQSLAVAQDIDEGDLNNATRKLPSDLRVVTLMRLDDPIAGPYADNLAKALKGLKPPFSVTVLKLATSAFRGVIVCQNSAADVKVGKALQDAVIVSEIKPKASAVECKQIGQATDEDGHRPLIGEPSVNGTLIFVGHRRLPPQ